MVRLIHAADFHLDSPFSALTEEKAMLRRREQRALLEKLCALAEGQKADLLLLSGDLLDSGRSYAETFHQLSEVLAGIPARIFISPGKHDFYSDRAPYESNRWRANVHIFKSPQISGVFLPELSLKVWGAAFISDSAQPILKGFTVPDASVLNIMTLHGEVGNPNSQYNPIHEGEIAASGLDYLALGHVHTYSGLKKAGKTFFAWPGCPEGRGFDETGEKGVICAEIDKDACVLSFCPLGERRYEIRSIGLTQQESIAEAIEAMIPHNSGKDIYRLILRGSRKEQPDIAALEEQFQDRFFQLEIKDRTDLRADLWAQAGEDSLRDCF
jgi:DNA repair exonuclease SbcCD nuclease subunit